MASQFKVVQPVEYYEKFLEQDVRPDGRELGQARHTIISIGCVGTAEGSALVKLGNTTVMCGVKAEITVPKPEHPKQGFVVPNVDLPPLCSPHFKPGPPTEKAQAASIVMDKILTSSGCIDLDSLCIESAKYVWVLYCDLMCLDYDGNLIDACAIALLAALRQTQLPRVVINEDSGLPEADFSVRLPLTISQQPIATSFTVFRGGVLLVDPTREEEELSEGALTVVILRDGSCCLLDKAGGESFTDSRLEDCVRRARARSKHVCALIDETLQTLSPGT